MTRKTTKRACKNVDLFLERCLLLGIDHSNEEHDNDKDAGRRNHGQEGSLRELLLRVFKVLKVRRVHVSARIVEKYAGRQEQRGDPLPSRDQRSSAKLMLERFPSHS